MLFTRYFYHSARNFFLRSYTYPTVHQYSTWA